MLITNLVIYDSRVCLRFQEKGEEPAFTDGKAFNHLKAILSL